MAGKAKTNEAVHVEATVIDTDLAALSASEEWLAEVNERAELLAEQYRPHDVTDEQDYKDSKRARADANREIAAIEQERKNMTAAIKKAVREFEAGSKRALAPLTGIVAAYDEKNHAYEARWKAEREVELAQEYEAIAPDLVPLVPFDRLMARYGTGRGKVWTNRSTNVEAAKGMLADAVEAVAEGERTIADLADPADAEEVKARFFDTLDLQAALAEARRLREQRERVRQLEEQRHQREAEERLAREEAERRAAEGAQDEGREEPPADYQPAEAEPERIPYEPPRIIPAPTMHEAPVAPAPDPTPAPVAPAHPAQAADVPRHWVVDVPSATRAQMQELAGALSKLGLQGTIRPAKTVDIAL